MKLAPLRLKRAPTALEKDMLEGETPSGHKTLFVEQDAEGWLLRMPRYSSQEAVQDMIVATLYAEKVGLA